MVSPQQRCRFGLREGSQAAAKPTRKSSHPQTCNSSSQAICECRGDKYLQLQGWLWQRLSCAMHGAGPALTL